MSEWVPRPWFVTASLAVGWILFATPVCAAPSRVNIPGGDLRGALAELVRQTGAELLYDEALVRGRKSSPALGNLTADAALARLLSGSGLGYRRTPDGTLVLFALTSRAPPQPPEAEPADAEPIPEILVIGRRTQNVDIRRRMNDVQPYQVATGDEIVRSHRDNLDQYFRSRVTANTQVLAPSLLNDGETVSEIDLRGLGPDGTLVLLDGRRMPSIPASANPLSFRQSDLNAIPLHAIERVETLTGTAGGIYGNGALGGVINVILKRDYRGADLHGTAGIASRGDGRRLSLEGRFGFTPDEGTTDFMVYLSHARSQPLAAGKRGFSLRDRQEIASRLPQLYEDIARSNQFGNSISVFNLTNGADLVFKPEFGGATLGSDNSFLPVGFDGTPADLASALAQRAGQFDLTQSDPEALSELGSHARTSAAIVNIRRRFGSRVEAFVDALILRNRGRHDSHESGTGSFVIPADSPANPFTSAIKIFFPTPEGRTERRTRFDTRRYTAGAIVSLPHEWRSTAEVTFGGVEYRSKAYDEHWFRPELDDLNPLGPWDDFKDRFTEDPTNLGTRFINRRIRTKYREQALRLAGPLLDLGAGAATLTLLAERRRERVPGHKTQLKFEGSDEIHLVPTADRASRTTSFYGELRAPLTSSLARFPLFRRLEVQAAVRRDDLMVRFSQRPEADDPGEELDLRFRTISYTAGAKGTPWPWLTLRGSYATGRQPPPLEDLIAVEFVSMRTCVIDPKRENRRSCIEEPLLRKRAGSPDLDPVRASTLSLGAVVTPMGEAGPRLSVDYSRIRRKGDPYYLDENLVLAHEERWPERVAREPLTDEDRAAGFTGGRITMLDVRATNGSDRFVETIDGRIDWPMRFLGGRLRAYGVATFHMTNRQKGLFEPAVERVGYRTGPLKLRANAGVEWVRGSTVLGANVQYFGKYRITAVGQGSAETEFLGILQGSSWVAPQAYLDLNASRRFRLGRSGREVRVDIGVVNVLDKSPPREVGLTTGAPGYSRYGDPRRRRFDVVLSSEF